jgi:hypothetical protein
MAAGPGRTAKYLGWIWKALVAVLTLAGGVATFVSEDFRLAVQKAAEWLYPLWLILGQALITVALLVALLLTRRALVLERGTSAAAREAQATAEANVAALELRLAPGRTDHDVGVLRAIRETLPRADVDYWRDVDFGGTWHGDRTHHLMQMVYDHNAIEDRFVDPELEPLRVDLFDAVKALMSRCAQYGIPGSARLEPVYPPGGRAWGASANQWSTRP